MKQGWYKSEALTLREIIYINRKGDKFLLVMSKKVRCFSSAFPNNQLVPTEEQYNEFVEWFDLEGKNPLTEVTVNDVIIMESILELDAMSEVDLEELDEEDLMTISDNLSHLIDYSYTDLERFREEWVPKFQSKFIGRESRDILSINNFSYYN